MRTPHHTHHLHRWCQAWIACVFAATTPSVVATVDINQASPLDLQAFKGIGPAMGQRILEARRQQGFHNWPDLMARVPGMGPHKADALSAQGLTVNGLRYGEVGDPPARPWQPFEALPLKPMPLPSKANRHP